MEVHGGADDRVGQYDMQLATCLHERVEVYDGQIAGDVEDGLCSESFRGASRDRRRKGGRGCGIYVEIIQ